MTAPPTLLDALVRDAIARRPSIMAEVRIRRERDARRRVGSGRRRPEELSSLRRIRDSRRCARRAPRTGLETPGLAGAGLLVLLVALAAPAAVAGEPPEALAIREFWQSLDAVWKEGDAEQFSELFTEDGSFRFPDRGQGLEGRAEIHRHFAAQFPRVAADVEHVTTVRQVYVVTSNVRLIDGTVEVLRRGEGSEQATVLRRFFITGVMLETEAGWRIRALRAFEIEAAADGGARITEGVEDRPWGYRQFTLEDLDGHRLTFFRFLDDGE